MRSLLIVGIVVLGIVFSVSVMLMSSKGGLWFGIGGAAAGWNEYGSKKTLEWTLKKVALVTGIAFIALSVALPYISN